jgi:hypothetical protein
MTRPVWATSFGSEFDDFLFAPIGEESNGMMLSVISALARLDLDPWHETVKLAELPGETATTRLASLIAALPGVPSAHQNPEAIAARLVALLPRGHNSKVESRKVQIGADAVTKLRVGIFMYAVFILVVLPSTDSEDRQRFCASLQHGVPIAIAAKVWRITSKWAVATEELSPMTELCLPW